MANLIAIGYGEETTAALAEAEIERLGGELQIEPDAVAVIVRDGDGKYIVRTHHHAVGAPASWGMFWEMLFGLLYFVPVFGMAVGAGLGGLMSKVENLGIDDEFQEQARDLLQPGTSTLFVVAEEICCDRAIEALSRYGGSVLRAHLSEQGECELQEYFHREPAL